MIVGLLLALSVLAAAPGCAAGRGADGPRPVPADGVAPSQHRPVALDIPSIGVHAPLLPLGLLDDGSVEVPPLGSPAAGWYSGSPAPGERGPAVLLGHVDSAQSGPGVFFALRHLHPGDRITVTRTDGSVVAFGVESLAEYPKAGFPTATVYGDIDHPGLRLITCTGTFDRAARSYVSNLVVYASAQP